MMRQILFTALLFLPIAAGAEEAWVALDGAEIKDALSGRVLAYGEKWQDFRASGRTLYFSGAEAWGYWEVRGDHYCSMWPPSDLWACYGIERRADALRFVGAAGDVTEAVYRAPRP